MDLVEYMLRASLQSIWSLVTGPFHAHRMPSKDPLYSLLRPSGPMFADLKYKCMCRVVICLK